MPNKTFIKITNEDIYTEIQSLKIIIEELKKIRTEVTFLRRMVYSLSGAVFTGFLFIVGYLLRS